MISSGSAVNSTLTRNDPGVSPASFVLCYLSPVLQPNAEVVSFCTQEYSIKKIRNEIVLKNSLYLLI